MLYSHTVFETAQASKYLQQLCKHFGHKVAVAFDAREGRVAFSIGNCLMRAGEGRLHVICRALGPEELKGCEGVITAHLERFAWREAPVLQWDGGRPGGVAPEEFELPDAA